MFKNLKSLFVTGGDGSKKTTAESASAEETVVSTNQPSSETSANKASTSAQSTDTTGEVNDQFVDILFGAMEKNNLSGFDYIEFKQSLRNLAKISMDEGTRFQSAFATAKTMGATPQKLVDAATHYMNVLAQEESKFKQALSNQQSKQIGDKEQMVLNLGQLIKTKEQQIEQLHKEIEADKANLQMMQEDISSASVKVEKTKNDFVASYNALVGQIQKDIENIKKYLM